MPVTSSKHTGTHNYIRSPMQVHKKAYVFAA